MKISVITINYNNARELTETIESVVGQSYSNIEYIIIDGASTDESIEIIKRYEKEIDYWVSEKDRGIYHAMNKGIGRATGDYLIFINSGDCFINPSIVEEVAPVLDKDIVYGGCKWVYNTNSEVNSFPQYLTLDFFYRASLPHQATFIHKRVFNIVGLYSEHFKIISDWELWVKAIFKHNCTYKSLSQVISIFDAKGISNKPEGKRLTIAEKDEVFKKNFPGIHEDYVYFHNIRHFFYSNWILKVLRKLRFIKLEKVLRNAKNGY